VPPVADGIETPAAFYFDLASPLAYLAAEQVLRALPVAAEWRPVLDADLPGEPEPGSPHELATEAARLGLQEFRLPAEFPFDSSLAMRVATYARSIGRTVPFAQAAFRQAFAGGHSLEDPDYVLISAAACEMHPAAVLKGAALRSIGKQLADTTAAAAELGVRTVPAISWDGVVFEGRGLIAAAAARIGSHAA
jgi:2-hydroxychromene-2-carboxylate isomerase